MVRIFMNYDGFLTMCELSSPRGQALWICVDLIFWSLQLVILFGLRRIPQENTAGLSVVRLLAFTKNVVLRQSVLSPRDLLYFSHVPSSFFVFISHEYK